MTDTHTSTDRTDADRTDRDHTDADGTDPPDTSSGQSSNPAAGAAPVAVRRIECTVDWPPGHVACYLLEAEEPILIDAGAPDDRGAEELRAGLSDHGYAPADLEHVIVTHPHTDHDGQVASLLEAGDPTVYAPGSAVARLARDADNLERLATQNARLVGVPEGVREYVVTQAVESLERNRRYCPPEEVDVHCSPGERFEAGGVTFDPIHCPGHQADQLAFAATLAGAGEHERALFSADAVIEPFRAAALHTGLDEGTFDAIDASYRCYESLRDREFDRVYPGHGPVFDDYAGAVERSIESLDDLLDDVADTLADIGPAPPYEVATARADISQQPYVLFETIGACATLEGRDRASSTVEDGARVFSV